jgi:hypothetical protein
MQRANLRVRAAARGAETRLGAAGRLLAACASLAHGTLNLVALAGRRLAPRRVECAHRDAACVDGAALNYLVIARAPAGAGERHGPSLGAGSGGE